MPIRDVLAVLLVVAIWGFNFVVIKLSVDALPPILAAALRFTFAAFPAVLFFKPPVDKWRHVLGFGLSFGFGLYAFLNMAIYLGMTAGLASVVLQVQAFFTLIFAFFVLGDKPRQVQILGGVIAFGGIGVIAFERFGGAGLLPLILTVCGAASWALSHVIVKKAGNVSPIGIAVWGAVVAIIPLYGLSFAVEGVAPLVAFVRAPDLWTIGVIAFLAYPSTLMGVAIWNHILSKHPASVVAPFTLLVPITGLLAGWLVLGETISEFELTGGALVVAGLAVTLYRSRKGRAVPQTPS